MHKLSIPKSVVDRIIARRGREHVYDNLDPRKTALVVVDMQNAFMLPGVAHSLVPDGAGDRAQHQPARGGRARDRRHGGLDQDHVHEETLKSWSTYYGMSRPEQNAKRIEALTADSKGHELWPALDVRRTT